jgi:hypothetical protein
MTVNPLVEDFWIDEPPAREDDELVQIDPEVEIDDNAGWFPQGS